MHFGEVTLWQLLAAIVFCLSPADAIREIDATAYTISTTSTDPTELIQGLKQGDNFRPVTGFRRVDGVRKVRFEQTYNDIPVYGSVVVMEKNSNGEFYDVSDGELFEDILTDLDDTDPMITIEEAIDVAIAATSDAESAFKSEAVVDLLVSDEGGYAHLIYRVKFLAKKGSGYSSPVVIVDADTGEVLRSFESLMTESIQIGGVGGNLKFGKYVFGNPAGNCSTGGGSSTPQPNAGPTTASPEHTTEPSYYDDDDWYWTEESYSVGTDDKLLIRRRRQAESCSANQFPKLTVDKLANGKCALKSKNTQIYHVQGKSAEQDPGLGELLKEVYSVDCVNNFNNVNDFANGGYSPANDAFFYSEKTFEMFQKLLKKPAVKVEPPGPLKIAVHFGTNHENAFYYKDRCFFGNGATTFYPLVDVNVVAHELAHGFTEDHSNLEYTGMSGGMNEAFSDMAGEALEYYLFGKVDWIVGGASMKEAGKGLRYFDDPTKDGHSIGHARDFRSDMDVHLSSGVYNKAFYNLANSNGWNVEKAFRVFGTANVVYWGAKATFNTGACGVRKAAADLKLPTQDVINAFSSVGVTCTSAK
ncbi:uncharacterized protein LOC106154862 [Lingula anatina]|uniref:Uncharacterized protein LOC106154862 n=1 Tax=Lingula anatina TaxID=7574 RepID=A0A1S3HH72_LINAN|nr:uncharacterized protein LOC106154862 [Lingula anatina]|eukprot:XP_013384836.1 uncharacterized protein LOC106154862 [Lingula anatina]